MSWEQYTTNLLQTGHVKKAAICGLNPPAVWTQNGLQISAADAASLVRGFSDPSSFQTNGLNLSGTRYIFVNADSDLVHAKKGQNGCCIGKTGQCLVIGVYGEGQQPGNAAKAVGTISDYLKSTGY